MAPNSLFAFAFSLLFLVTFSTTSIFITKKIIYIITVRNFFFFHPQVPRGVSARSTGVTSKVRRVLRIMKEALPYAESFEKRACVWHGTDASTPVLSPFLCLFLVRSKFAICALSTPLFASTLPRMKMAIDTPRLVPNPLLISPSNTSINILRHCPSFKSSGG